MEEIPAEEAERLAKEMQERMRAAHDALKSSFAAPRLQSSGDGEGTPVAAEATVETGVPAERLRELSEELVHVPEGFTVNPKLVKMLERRTEALDSGGDWGHAESPRFQPARRGHPDPTHGPGHRGAPSSPPPLVRTTPRQEPSTPRSRDLLDATASFEAYNSPLSEYATLGFEYRSP